MGSIDYDFAGLNFGPHRSAVLGSIVPALGSGIETLRAKSVEKTPEDTGNLREEAYTQVFEAVGDGAFATATLTFPGPYARYQHYELELHHRVGQALYLEQPMVQDATEVLGEVGQVIGKAAFE